MEEKIYFTGFMGSGKTTVSREFAKKFKISWMDTDEEAEKYEGKKISEMFAEKGEEYFRNIETNVLKKIAQKSGGGAVSCGGGAVLRDENIEIMKKSGKVVYLKASPETIFEHVRYSHNRPLLEGNMNTEYISSLMDKRLGYYEKAADITIDTDKKTIKDILCELEKICSKALA